MKADRYISAYGTRIEECNKNRLTHCITLDYISLNKQNVTVDYMAKVTSKNDRLASPLLSHWL
ncbi:hypothetical protein V6259_09305 [Marinomonas sp. TI.3.20]|uniref:hypothetical protein n=1 Tax=Marinomonas sp. TI.3.20 TaxID=3121296 RepID=UPI00311E2533